MSINDTPPPLDSAPSEAAFFATVRKWGIVRGADGIIGGVAAGVGSRLGLAPWPARLIVILIAILLFPLAMLGYAFGWAVLPDTAGRIVIQDFGRGVTNVGALIGIAVFALIGFLSFGDLQPFGNIWFGTDVASVDPESWLRVGGMLLLLLVPVAIAVAAVVVLVLLVRRSSSRSGAAPSGAPEPVYALTPAQARAAAGGQYPQAANAAFSATAAPSTPAAMRPAQSAPLTPRPAPPRVPGPGRGFYLAVLAWAPLAAAGVAWADREAVLSIYPPLAWGMVFMTGLGVILILVSLSGRRLGFLGFLGGLTMIPALLLLGWHADFLNSYANSRDQLTFAVTEYFDEPQSVDPTVKFMDDYDTVFFGGSCWEDGAFSADTFGSTARLTVPFPVTDDVSHDILASTTTVSVPTGTGLRVTSDGWAQATVYFKDRDLVCRYPGEEGDYIVLTNANQPVVTLAVLDDFTVNTIVIEEN